MDCLIRQVVPSEETFMQYGRRFNKFPLNQRRLAQFENLIQARQFFVAHDPISELGKIPSPEDDG